MHTVAESTPDTGTNPLPVKAPTNDYGEPPDAGTLTGHPATVAIMTVTQMQFPAKKPTWQKKVFNAVPSLLLCCMLF